MAVDNRRGEMKDSSTGIDGYRWVSTGIDHHLAPVDGYRSSSRFPHRRQLSNLER
jgi:hypothetical protein